MTEVFLISSQSRYLQASKGWVHFWLEVAIPAWWNGFVGKPSSLCAWWKSKMVVAYGHGGKGERLFRLPLQRGPSGLLRIDLSDNLENLHSCGGQSIHTLRIR